jgi:hypothetical protein
MKTETIEYLRSLVNAEAKRPGSGANFHHLIDSLRLLDGLIPLANMPPATGVLTTGLAKLHEEECWGGKPNGFIFNTDCGACLERLSNDQEAQNFLGRTFGA